MNPAELEREVLELQRRLADLALTVTEQPARVARPVDGGSPLAFGVIREISDPDTPFVWITRGEVLSESPWFQLPENTAEEIRVDMGTFGRNYEQWVWEGDEEDFPDAPWVPGMVPLPLLNTGGETIVWHHSRLWYPDPLPEALIHTDCYLVDGGGAQVEMAFV